MSEIADLERRHALFEQGLLDEEAVNLLRQDIFDAASRRDIDLFEEQRTPLGQLYESGIGVARGFLGSLATLGEGLGEQADEITNLLGAEDLIDSREENELVRISREAQESIQERLGADVAYRDQWLTKFGEGGGSLLSYLTPGAALKALSLPKMAYGATVAMTGGVYAGEQAQRKEAARQQGIEITPGEEAASTFASTVVGWSEMLPVHRLLRFIPKSASAGFKKGIVNKIKNALTTGGIEGVQEVTASILQDAVERGIYNESLPFNDSLMDDFTIGSAVGTFADLALSSVAGRSGRKRSLQAERDLRVSKEEAKEGLAGEVTEGQEQERLGADTPLPEFVVEDDVTPDELMAFQESLDKEMKGAGLSDIKANVFHALRNVLRNRDGNIIFGIRQRREGEQDVRTFGGQSNIVVEEGPQAQEGETIEGIFSDAAGQIFVAADALPKEGTLDEQRDSAVGILKHEQLHAMRAMDLFTDAEWRILTNAVSQKNKKGTAGSYMDWAADSYDNLSPVELAEEAVAEMTRDLRTDNTIVTGKPRTLLQRIIDFFPKLNNFIKGRGYTTFDSLIRDIDAGKIGGRKRGEVRTLKNLEELESVVRQPDFDTTGAINQEREEDFPAPLQDAASIRKDDTGAERLNFLTQRLAFVRGSLEQDTEMYPATRRKLEREARQLSDELRGLGIKDKYSMRQRFRKGDQVFHVGSKLRGVIVKRVPLFGSAPEKQTFMVEMGDLGTIEVPESLLEEVVPTLQDKFSRQGLPIKTRVPAPEELSPILPIGEVEQGLLDVFKTSEAPTSSQLAKVTGSPSPRTSKTKSGRKIKNKLDSNVKPTPFTTLRMMARVGLAGDSLKWYDQFGKGIREIVGEKNLPEASVVFGITSQQNSAEQNLADTLHIMAVARKIDPVKDKDKFIKELRKGQRPGGQGLKITGDQINRITRLYNEGFAEAGLKTSTYMQMIQDRAANNFNPFSVQDVHMARVFGFNRKKIDPDSNQVVDDAKIPTDNSYRYAQFLTSKLAEEFRVTPNQMQAALWFYAKSNLSPLKESGRKGKPGTWDSAKNLSQPEIKQIQDMVNSGVFDKNNAATPALADPIKASNKITTKNVSFSNILQNEDLLSVARARAPKAVFSANPGNDRGYGFPTEVELSEIVDFNREAIDVITDESGQIPFLRDLGISHEVTETFGSYEGIEPSITVKLLDGTPRQASFAANILGDALLQDAAIMARPSFGSGSQVGVALQKKDGSNFELEELEVIGRSVNPEKSPYGLNFTLVSPDVLSFMDGRVYDDSVVYNEVEMLPEFIEELSTKLPASLDVDMGAFYQEGDYFESSDYKKNIRIIGSEGTVPGSSDIYGRIDDTLYKPFWELYTRTAERLGFEPDTKERPDPRVDERGQPLKIESVGEMSVLRERADGSLVGGDSDIEKVTRDAGAVQKVVRANEEAAINPSVSVPPFNPLAEPEAQYVAKNPEEGLKPSQNLKDKFSRKKEPPLSPEISSIIDGIASEPAPMMTPGETYIKNTQSSNIQYFLDKSKQAALNKYARLERYARDPLFKDNLADTSAIAAAYFADRSMGITGSALKYGVPVYQNGVTQVKAFYHNGKKYRGLIDVMAPLYQNDSNFSLERLAQAYAIAKRAEGQRARGLKTPVPEGQLQEIEAEIAKYKNKDGVPIIEEWYEVWQAYNNKTVEFMKATGIVDDALAQKWMEMSDYVPFYRQAEAEDGEIANISPDAPVMFKRNMTSSIKLKELKGSEKAINIPMLDAITRNLSMAIDAGMKNVAQQRIVRDMTKIGIANPATAAQRKNMTQNFVVNFKVNGVDQYYKIHDPLIYESLQSVDEMGGAITGMFGGASRWLRELVTRDPGFMAANLMRDTLSAYVTSGADFTPVVDTVAAIGKDVEDLESFGVVGGYDFSNDPEDMVEAFTEQSKKRGINVDGKNAIFNPFKKVWDWAGQGTTLSDAATRRAVYDDVLARTGNEAEAAFQALEIINFSRRGRNPAVRFLTTAIPFLNARFQGLDVLYRGFMGYNPAQKNLTRGEAALTALSRGALITATTLMYWLMFSDSEEYKEATDEQKDLNWIFPNPFGGRPIRIPVPFEVGLIFKTIPERIFDSYSVAEVFGKTGDTSDRELFESIVMRGVGSTLAINPLGIQLVGPVLEAAINHNSFTNSPIVPIYVDKNGVDGLLGRESNTEISKAVGLAMDINPMKIDHVLYGYTGTIGAYVLDAVDRLVFKNPAVTGKDSIPPEMSIDQYPVVKRFVVSKFSSGERQDFYRLRAEVQKVTGSLKKLEEAGRYDELEALLRAKGHLANLSTDVNYISRELSKLRDQRREIERLPASIMGGKEKREAIDAILEEMSYYTDTVSELKRYADLPALSGLPLSEVIKVMSQ